MTLGAQCGAVQWGPRPTKPSVNQPCTFPEGGVFKEHKITNEDVDMLPVKMWACHILLEVVE